MDIKLADKWYETHDMGNGVTLILESHVAPWLRCNMWHVRGRERDLLIDTGLGLRPLKQEIAALAERPITVIQSHSHFDHAGGSHEFDCRLGHEAEAHLMADPAADEPGEQVDYYPFIQAETFSALPYEGFDASTYRVTPAPLTGYLDEGDVVDLGDRVFQVLHMPGHSPGSIGLYDKAARTLFSGDIIYNGDLFDTVYHSDPEVYRESLARLRTFDVEIIHGGHFTSFGQARMLEIIEGYFAGRNRIADAEKWVDEKIALKRRS